MTDEEFIRIDKEMRERHKRERKQQLLPFYDICSYSLRTREWKGWAYQEIVEKYMDSCGWTVVCWAPGTLWIEGKSAGSWPHCRLLSQTTGEFMEFAFVNPVTVRKPSTGALQTKFQVYHIETLAILGEGREAYPYAVVLRKSQIHNSLPKAIDRMMQIHKMPTEEQKLQWLVSKIEYERDWSERLAAHTAKIKQDKLDWEAKIVLFRHMEA